MSKANATPLTAEAVGTGGILSPTVEAGNAGSFLLKACEEGTTDELLIGPTPRPPSSSSQQQQQQQSQEHATPYQNLVAVSKFLASYRARKTLADNDASGKNDDFYLSAVQDFARTQLDRQKVGLRTNTDKESAQVMAQVVASHTNTLIVAMQHAENEQLHRTSFEIPKKEFLCSWHSLLCPTNRQSGRFRANQARAGNTLFCPSQNLDREMQSFAAAMETLHQRWSNQILMGMSVPVASVARSRDEAGSEDSMLIRSTYYSLALAAIMLYGISDIHCFADGNGRMARICTNWIFRRLLGLPFSVSLTATPLQRAEYVAGLKSSLNLIQKAERHGFVASAHVFVPGIFQRLIFLLLDRIAHAVHGCEQMVEERSRAVTESEESRIARIVRDRAATGQCVICLEDNPNILTICCGQATHLNCLAEWLATANNCVACRKTLPTLQIKRPPTPQAAGTDDQNGIINEPINAAANPRNDVWNAVLTSMLWEAAESSAREEAGFCNNENCRNRSAGDCENAMCGRCCILHGNFSCERHQDGETAEQDAFETTEEQEEGNPIMEADTATSTYEYLNEASERQRLQQQQDEETIDSLDSSTLEYSNQAYQQQQQQEAAYCRRCSNRAAVDCANGMCGRHCVLHGWYTCIRHNAYR